MAALAESVGVEALSLAGLPTPVILRLPVPLNDEELIAFSSRNRPYRIERNAKGELEIMTPVGGDGGYRESLVNLAVALWAKEHGGFSFSSNTGFRLPDGSVLSPDVAWVAHSRYSGLTREARRSFPPLCPDFIIEILSSTDSRPVLETKMHLWLANGAKLAWMIDPYSATLSIYRSVSPVQVLQRPESVEADGPVQGFSLRTLELWNP